MSSLPPATQPRKYRSRTQKPCDLCRKRRICCIREPGNHRCSLCKTRGIDCTYVSAPPIRHRTPKERVQRSNAGNTPQSLPGTESPRSVGTSREKPHHTLQYVGLSGDHDPYLLQPTSDEKRQGDTAWACQRVSDDPDMPAQFTIVPDQHLDAQPSYYPKNNVEEAARPHKEALIKAYFDTVHSSFPILDPTAFDVDSSPTPLLAAMYALSHKFCPEAGGVDPWIFLNFLGRALPLEARNPKLDSIEASLLYSQRHTYIFRTPTMPGMVAEIGSLVGMSHDVGLNIDPTNWRIPEAEKKRRIRLWWAVYMQDKWTALILGRPSFLHEDQNNVPMVTTADIDHIHCQSSYTGSPSQSLSNISKTMFVAMAELSVLLSDILSTFYTVRGIHTLSDTSLQEGGIINSFTNRLDEWARLHDILLRSTQKILPDPTGTLQLAYYTAEITLCRAILRKQNSHSIRRRGETISMKALGLLQTIQIYRLRAFWWSVSKVNFAIVGAFMFSMLLTSVDRDEASSWESRIDEYLSLLEAHSITFDVTKLSFIRLQLLQKVDRLNDQSTTADHSVNTATLEQPADPAVVPSWVSSYNQREGECSNTFDPLSSWRVMNEDPFGDWGDLEWTSLLDLE